MILWLLRCRMRCDGRWIITHCPGRLVFRMMSITSSCLVIILIATMTIHLVGGCG